LANKVLKAFDKSINDALATRVKTRYTFKVNHKTDHTSLKSLTNFLFLKGKLNTYRFCDNVWTLLFNEIEFKELQEVIRATKVKFVACDGKSKHCFL
jgi:transcription initiation factor TFIIA small subunit